MIKIYIDAQTTNTIESLDLGRVLLGETKKYTVFIKNTDTELDSRKPLRTEFKFSGDIFIG